MYHFSVLGLTSIIAEQTRRVKNEMYYLFLFIGCVKCFIPLKNIELGNCGKMDVDLENFNAQSQSAGVNSTKKNNFASKLPSKSNSMKPMEYFDGKQNLLDGRNPKHIFSYLTI